ncbi:DUF5685 family protein [Clostridium carnis]
MFGYVTPLKAELKVKDFAKFKSYYCGLCFHIKKDFGNIPRMALNYDMTFLAILLDALSIEDSSIEIKRCMLHPTSKKPVISNNKALSYAAAMNLSLFYYKLLDDVNDDNNIKSKSIMNLLSPYMKKANKSIDKINNITNINLTKLNNLEKNKNFSSIDEISHPFSHIVGNILKSYPNPLTNDNDVLRQNLYNLGYTLGKWIYLIDALDDLKEDIEKNKFNPINFLYNKDNLPYKELLPKIKDRIEFTILNCSYNCKECLLKLPLKRNNDILFNVLELGMMDKYINVLNNTDEKKRSDFNHESI